MSQSSEVNTSLLDIKTPLPYGPFAALLTPRRSSGEIDEKSFISNLELALSQGMKGVCICGATGEYVHTAWEEKARLIKLAAQYVKGRGCLLYCAGGSGLIESVAEACYALEMEAAAVLLPPPYFYRYDQDDLAAFYREAARQIPGPVLLYNLPLFTNEIEEHTALRLIEQVPNIIGIKDSSGSLKIVESLSTQESAGAYRLVGNDRVLSLALEQEICDGAISGVAGVLPELIAALFASHATHHQTLFQRTGKALNELLMMLDNFPAPWGLKLMAEARGLGTAFFPLPLSETRSKQVSEFQSWFDGWWNNILNDIR